MISYVLVRDIYTARAIDAGVGAFARLCNVTAQHDNDHSVVKVFSADDRIAAELLNYILAISAQELLS